MSGNSTEAVDPRLREALDGVIDLDAERARLTKSLAAAEKELAGTTGKLGNEQFLSKAPEAVVAKIKARQELAVAEVERLKAKLVALGEK